MLVLVSALIGAVPVTNKDYPYNSFMFYILFFKNGHMEQQYAKASGNVERPGDESSQPFVGAVHVVEDLHNVEVKPANDSSISPYTHLAVSDVDVTKKPAVFNDTNRSSSSDVFVSNDPVSYVLPHIEANILSSKLESPIQSYVPAEHVPSSGNSSSTIAPYTTVEQTAEPDITWLSVNPNASDGVRCQNGMTKISDSDVTDDSCVQVELCKLNDNYADFQPAYTNLHKVSDENACSEYVSGTNVLISAKAPLPVSYIPVAPILSS